MLIWSRKETDEEHAVRFHVFVIQGPVDVDSVDNNVQFKPVNVNRSYMKSLVNKHRKCPLAYFIDSNVYSGGALRWPFSYKIPSKGQQTKYDNPMVYQMVGTTLKFSRINTLPALQVSYINVFTKDALLPNKPPTTLDPLPLQEHFFALIPNLKRFSEASVCSLKLSGEHVNLENLFTDTLRKFGRDQFGDASGTQILTCDNNQYALFCQTIADAFKPYMAKVTPATVVYCAWNDDIDRTLPRTISLEEARKVFCKHKVRVADGKSTLSLPLFDVWHNCTRAYDAVTLHYKEGLNSRTLNAWSGYAYSMDECIDYVVHQPDQALQFLQMVLELCRELCTSPGENYVTQQRLAQHLLFQMASFVQHPDHRPSVMYVLYDRLQGNGKSTWTQLLLDIFGPLNSMTTANHKIVTGHFNASVAVDLMVLEELTASQIDTNEVTSALKNLITNPWQTIVKKYQEPTLKKIALKMIATTNRKWIDSGRRYTIIECGGGLRGNKEWFEKFYHLKEVGGIKALILFLMALPLDAYEYDRIRMIDDIKTKETNRQFIDNLKRENGRGVVGQVLEYLDQGNAHTAYVLANHARVSTRQEVLIYNNYYYQQALTLHHQGLVEAPANTAAENAANQAAREFETAWCPLFNITAEKANNQWRPSPENIEHELQSLFRDYKKPRLTVDDHGVLVEQYGVLVRSGMIQATYYANGVMHQGERPLVTTAIENGDNNEWDKQTIDIRLAQMKAGCKDLIVLLPSRRKCQDTLNDQKVYDFEAARQLNSPRQSPVPEIPRMTLCKGEAYDNRFADLFVEKILEAVDQ